MLERVAVLFSSPFVLSLLSFFLLFSFFSIFFFWCVFVSVCLFVLLIGFAVSVLCRDHVLWMWVLPQVRLPGYLHLQSQYDVVRPYHE